MPRKSPFAMYKEQLSELVKERSYCTYDDYMDLYFKFKSKTNVVQILGAGIDYPPLTEEDRAGNKDRKQSNQLYTWLKNECRRGTCTSDNFSRRKEDWEKFADANQTVVMEYVQKRPALLAKLQGITDVHSRQSADNAPDDTIEVLPMSEKVDKTSRKNLTPRWSSKTKKILSDQVIAPNATTYEVSDNVVIAEVHQTTEVQPTRPKRQRKISRK